MEESSLLNSNLGFSDKRKDKRKPRFTRAEVAAYDEILEKYGEKIEGQKVFKNFIHFFCKLSISRFC